MYWLQFSVWSCRCPRVRRSRRLYPGTVRGKEQINHQRDLLSHDVCDGYQQHTVCVRRSHRRHHRQQPKRMRTVLDHTTAPYKQFTRVKGPSTGYYSGHCYRVNYFDFLTYLTSLLGDVSVASNLIRKPKASWPPRSSSIITTTPCHIHYYWSN